MARPPLALGHHGTIKTTREDGRWVSRCRFRDLDGVTRRVERWAPTKTAAQAALQDELKGRQGERTEVLRTNSRFREAADIWMGKIRERRAESTADTYASCLANQVLPQLGELRLSECDVAQLDAFFTRLERARRVVEHDDGTTTEKVRHAANTRRMIRAIVGGIMQQAVLHQAVAANPVRDLERIESPKGRRTAPPRGLTAEERRRLLAHVDADKTAVRADLPDLIRFALGSGLRIGELCAVRWMDLDLDCIPVASETDMRLVPVVAVRQNVYPVKGKGLAVHGGKSAMRCASYPCPNSSPRSCALAVMATTTPNGPCSPPPAAMDSRPTAGPRTCGAASGPSANRPAWGG